MFVTIAIPTYNRADTLSRAIDSALSQTYSNFEVLVVDNCSTDKTQEVMSAYEHLHNIRYIRNRTNLGMGGNWTECFRHANGEFVYLLHADDFMYPSALEKLVNSIDSSGCELAFARVKIIDMEKGRSMEMEHIIGPSRRIPGEELVSKFLVKGTNPAPPQTWFFRRDIVLESGTFKGGNRCCDIDMLFRLFLKNDAFYLNEVVAGYVWDGANEGGGNFLKISDDLRAVIRDWQGHEDCPRSISKELNITLAEISLREFKEWAIIGNLNNARSSLVSLNNSVLAGHTKLKLLLFLTTSKTFLTLFGKLLALRRTVWQSVKFRGQAS